MMAAQGECVHMQEYRGVAGVVYGVCLRRLSLYISLLLLVALGQSSTYAAEDLTRLSLSELSEATVTSVSKKPELLLDTASSVFVITQEDIRRSGAMSVPEALRMVPGVHVARSNDGEWYVAVRGFNGELSNKLLVMIDGRSIYSPVFSGVFWYEQDLLMEDVERIEVIRGPGATMWGANAVNGVINIITRNAKDRQGLMVSVTGGTFERLTASVRYGSELGDDGYGSLWAKFYDRDELDDDHNKDPLLPDNWDSVAFGFRYDWDPSTPDAFSLQGQWRQLRADDSYMVGDVLAPPYNWINDYDRLNTLFHLMGRYTRRLSESSEASLQVYYDSDHNDYGNSDLMMETIDVDSQYRFSLGDRHDVVVGAGYRWVQDEYDPHDLYAITFFTPREAERDLPSLFVEDEFEVLSDVLSITVGVKAEENDYTGWEFQPSIRFLSKPSKSHRVWAAVSRATRIPSRIEEDGSGRVVTRPDGLPSPYKELGLPLLYVIEETELEAEDLLAYELGHRFAPNAAFWMDTTLFFNQYDHLLAYEPRSGLTEESDRFEYMIAMDNGKDGYSYGAELSSTWRVVDSWSLKAAYSYMDLHLDFKKATNFDFAGITLVEGTLPQHQCSLRSQWDVTSNIECDAWLRYVDELEALGVDEYITLDLRLAWRPRPNLEIALVGQNLGEEWHREYTSYEVERSVYAKVTVSL